MYFMNKYNQCKEVNYWFVALLVVVFVVVKLIAAATLIKEMEGEKRKGKFSPSNAFSTHNRN